MRDWVETRWQCQCGRFLADSAIHSEDRYDPSAYYGITTDTWGDCSRCGCVDEPRLIATKRSKE